MNEVQDISHRSKKFAKQFDYNIIITQLYSYELLLEEKHQELKNLESKIAAVRSELPKQILELYEQYRIVEKLGE
jgi:predicted  nucleic acid-binding Zn-ribbon protein